MKFTNSLIFFLLTLVIVLFVYFKLRPPDIIHKEVLRIDTIEIIKPKEKIILRKAKPKIIYRYDTIVKTSPFVVNFDTIVNKDTISVSYKFPENSLDFSVLPFPDTIYIPKFVYSFEKKKERWWEKPVVFLFGATLGYVLCKTKR